MYIHKAIVSFWIDETESARGAVEHRKKQTKQGFGERRYSTVGSADSWCDMAMETDNLLRVLLWTVMNFQ